MSGATCLAAPLVPLVLLRSRDIAVTADPPLRLPARARGYGVDAA
jgi:hypothetical protein